MRPFETIDEKLRDIASCKTMPKKQNKKTKKTPRQFPSDMKKRSTNTSHVTSTILVQVIVLQLRFAEGFGEGIFASNVFEHFEDRKRQYPNTIDIENLL